MFHQQDNRRRRHRRNLMGVAISLIFGNILLFSSNNSISRSAISENLAVYWRGRLASSSTNESGTIALHASAIGEEKARQIPLSVVVSLCDATLDWLPGYVKGHNVRKIYVYSKCQQKLPDDFADQLQEGVQLEFVELPNVGRCDHTYAHWIRKYVSKQDKKNDNEEIVFFLKDNQIMKIPGYDNLSVNEVIQIAELDGFSCILATVKGGSISHHQEEVKHGSIFHRLEELDRFHMGAYGHGNKNDEFKATYANLGDWKAKLDLPAPGVNGDVAPVCYAGMFAARSSNFAKVPLDKWEALEQSLERGDNIVEGHYAERTWGTLLRDPVSDKIRDEIVQQKSANSSIYFKGKYYS